MTGRDLAVGNQEEEKKQNVKNNNCEMTCIRCKTFRNFRFMGAAQKFVDAYLAVGSSSAAGSFCEFLVKKICSFRQIPPPSPQSQFLSHCGAYRPLVESFLVKGEFEIASNILLMRICNASITHVMKNIRGGKEDLHASLVAGFGYGVVISLTRGMRGPSVMSVGVMCALFNGGMYKAGIRMLKLDLQTDTLIWRR